ncbi:TGS protein [Dillenia turbinata]|uniref:GTP diphosphokinase n=1 Tax=Dillenia turbinata TaxID=194707 RepID=A0AAN8VRI9_9MAGN
MSPCQTSTMFSSIFHKTPPSLRRRSPFLGDSTTFFFNQTHILHNFSRTHKRIGVKSSLTSMITTGNVIAAAAAAAGSGSAHAAVTSALTHVAVTAVAIASGACLSTKVDFLWPKVEEQPGAFVLDGVDVTGYAIFNDEKVQKAIAFARRAHHGQFRKTGDPYITHCIHTGRILAVLVPSSGKRAVDTIVAGILHDVVDDTCENLHSIEVEFGNDVAKLVAGVSRLSYINQLLRRHRRINVGQGTLNHDEANNLRVMLLGMVDDPRVVLIKLADRLHNMRTIYALPTLKAEAVAQETLVIWCSLASRLGLWALKAELEDLCFAVLQPQTFQQMRAELASMWSPTNRAGNMRRVTAKSSKVAPLTKEKGTQEHDRSLPDDEDVATVKDLLQAVIPFELQLDRRKRATFLRTIQKCSISQTKPKVVRDAGIALASLAICEEALEKELLISTSYVPGMEVTLSGRLKSLYSIYSKMTRKDVGIRKVYDARALRVVVGDKNGTLHGPAVKCCYCLLDIIHRLWTPIDGELDDYIVNPKPSGYQSLHTAVQGPESAPLEVQIRTQRMHDYAEHGLAAHWLYKETENKLSSISSMDDSEIKGSSYLSKPLDDQSCIDDDAFQRFNSIKVGHPVLRVEGSHLLAAVIVGVDKEGRELLVAVSFGLAASEAVADRRSSNQIKRCLMSGGLNQDMGIGALAWKDTHFVVMQDQFQRLLPTFIQIFDFTEEEESEYWTVVSAVFEGKQVASKTSDSTFSDRPSQGAITSTSKETSINHKVNLLRTMLRWEEQLRSEAGFDHSRISRSYVSPESIILGEVVFICWPRGEIMRLRSGSTAADAAIRVGHEGKIVLVNGQLVLPTTELKDGDVVEVRV